MYVAFILAVVWCSLFSWIDGHEGWSLGVSFSWRVLLSFIGMGPLFGWGYIYVR